MNLNLWVRENLSEYVDDIAYHGAENGFPKITYYRDIIRLYEEHEKEIWEILSNVVEDTGRDSVFELFRDWEKAKVGIVYTHATFVSLAVLLAIEEVCWQISNHNARDDYREELE